MKPSVLELTFANHLRLARVPAPEAEYVFAKPRRYRFDFAWPEHWIAVELEGATWTGGRHTRGAGFAEDCAKYNLAASLGWTVYRFTAAMVRSGEALNLTEKALQAATARRTA